VVGILDAVDQRVSVGVAVVRVGLGGGVIGPVVVGILDAVLETVGVAVGVEGIGRVVPVDLDPVD
jgi:hypothetical protein